MDFKDNSILTQKNNNNKTETNIQVLNHLSTENINSKEYNDDILNLINSMPFENMSEYYDIESNIFLKRIEKLNLKFFWTSEYVLQNNEIKYPYNKLFLILFKQISLYIEEITRLNKQLKLKNKNEKFMKIKMAKLKEKEKENIFNKQMIKNLQRNNKILEKKNEKNKIEIEKLNKRIYKNINISGNNLTNSLFLNNKYKNNFYFTSPKNLNVSVGFDTIITHGSAFSKKSNTNKFFDLSLLSNDNNSKYRKKPSNSIDDNFIATKNKIINKSINQCDEEIENLEVIEDILINFKNKNNKFFLNGTNNNKYSLNKSINNKNNNGYNKKIRNRNGKFN